MVIICTSSLLGGETAEIDRECDVWYEKDFIVQGMYAVMVYPKAHWRPLEELVIVPYFPTTEDDEGDA